MKHNPYIDEFDAAMAANEKRITADVYAMPLALRRQFLRKWCWNEERKQWEAKR